MPEPALELLKGTLDLLILRTLDLRPMHGSAARCFPGKGRLAFSSTASSGTGGLGRGGMAGIH
jgi:hypothetical protein